MSLCVQVWDMFGVWLMGGLVIEGWACLCVQVWDMFGVWG